MVNPLARAVMKNVVRGKVGERSNRTYTNYSHEKRVGNLTSREEELLKELIYGKREVRNQTTTVKKHTLDELVNMMKKDL